MHLKMKSYCASSWYQEYVWSSSQPGLYTKKIQLSIWAFWQCCDLKRRSWSSNLIQSPTLNGCSSSFQRSIIGLGLIKISPRISFKLQEKFSFRMYVAVRTMERSLSSHWNTYQTWKTFWARSLFAHVNLKQLYKDKTQPHQKWALQIASTTITLH